MPENKVTATPVDQTKADVFKRAVPAHEKQFHQKLVSAEETVKAVKSEDFVYVHPGCAAPERLLDALVARHQELQDVKIMHLMAMSKADYANPGMEGHFRHMAFFTGKNVREAIYAGR